MLELLEKRNLLATITVTTLVDDVVTDGEVSLREAIVAANTDASVDGSAAGAGEDTIRFDDALFVSGDLESIVLADNLGQLPPITDDLIIEGQGRNQLSIDGSAAGSRIFRIAENVTVSISDLTLRDGDVSQADEVVGNERFGGAIFNAGDLTLSRITGINNHANQGGFLHLDFDVTGVKATIQESVISGNRSDTFGGALRMTAGHEFTMRDSVVENNTGLQAGAIANGGAPMEISGSRFSGNISEESGGAIRNFGSTVIRDSTFDNNQTDLEGGAIYLGANDLTLINTTISGNRAGEIGGALATMGFTEITLINSTVTNNRSDSDDNGNELGGGIAIDDNDVVVLNNTIVAGNFTGSGTTVNDIDGAVDKAKSFNNLVADADSSGGLLDGENGNVIGQDPKLTPLLASNDSPQRFHLFAADSPAVDAGSNDKAVDDQAVALTTDQIGRPRLFDGDGDSVATVDIGAIELDDSTLTLLVTTQDDEADNMLAPGFSLREAILTTNITAGRDTIRFDDALFAAGGATIQLRDDLGQLPVLTDEVVIEGRDVLEELSIFGAGSGSRIFEIAEGVTAEISGLTLINGSVTSVPLVTGKERFGGAIFNAGQLTLSNIFGHANGADQGGFLFLDQDVVGVQATIRDSVISANIADSFGGALRVFLDHQLTVVDSVIENNMAANGGGMANGGASVAISGSRFSANFSDGEGGAIRSFGSMLIRDSSFDRNQTDSTSGAIFVGANDVTIINSTLSRNTAKGQGGAIGTMDGTTVTLINSTVSANRSDSDDNGNQLGGGLFFGNADTVRLQNTIVAGNFAGTGTIANDIEGPVDLAGSFNNLIGDANSAGGLTDGVNGNLVDVDPKLGPLTPLGQGRILFFLPNPDSPAIDGGSNDRALDDQGAALTTDQRGLPRIVDGDKNGTTTVDIGAVEVDGLPLVLLVTSLSDEDDGTLARGDLGVLSLREAIRLSNANVGPDVIRFDESLFATAGKETIRLRDNLGQLPVLTDEVVIEGPGFDELSIFGASSGSRIFEIAEGVTAEISGLTLINGNVTSVVLVTGKERFGGAIFNAGQLTLLNIFGQDNRADQGGFLHLDQDILTAQATIRDSVVSGNTAETFGGALRMFADQQFTLTDSVIEDNRAANGGGMANGGADVLITGSRFSANFSDGEGGAIRSFGSTVIRNSSFDRNETDFTSGAIFVGANDLTIINSTLSGNTAKEQGGAIGTMDGTTVTLINSTVSANRSDSDDNGNGSELGGGLFFGSADTVLLQNTIVAGNFAGTGTTANDIEGPVDAAKSFNNLIGDAGSSGGLTDGVNGNLVGVDPQLGPLISPVDGIQRYYEPDKSSPVIDAGSNTLAVDEQDAALATDQIGNSRIVDGNDDTVATVDIGAIEFQPLVIPSPLVVTTLDDELDPDPLSNLNDLSLREAIDLANQASGEDTITFDEIVFANPATIALTLGELIVLEGASINGLGRDRVTVDAGGNSRVFNVTTATGNVTISGLTITGGKTTADNSGSTGDSTNSGGGIRFVSDGLLTITNSRITSNVTEGKFATGGGIFASPGDVTITDSTISINATGGDRAHGGGVHVEFGTLTLTTVLVRGNRLNGAGSGDQSYGGGVFIGSAFDVARTAKAIISDSMFLDNVGNTNNSGGGAIASLGDALTITSSTLAKNSTRGSKSSGGAIYTQDAAVHISDSTLSDNFTTGDNSRGGAIDLRRGTLRISNSTISGNSTQGAGSTLDGGGGIAADSGGDIVITNSTITGNQTNGTGGGIKAEGALTIRGSIVAGNVDNGTGPDVHSTSNLLEAVVSFSLIGDNTGTFLAESKIADETTGNLVGNPNGSGIIDPMLGPLTDNGGPSLTHALLGGSPAIDAGDPNAVAGDGVPEFDQRGTPFARIVGDRLDMGAFELSEMNAPLDVTGSGDPNPFQDGILILRYLFELGTEDLEGLSPAGATRTDGAEIFAYLEGVRDALDVNGDGAVNPFTDGILILRYLFELDDDDLEGLSPAGSTRTTGEEIRLYLDTLMPPVGEGELLAFQSSVTVGEGEYTPLERTLLNPIDVNGDGAVTPRDALNVINAISRRDSSLDVDQQWSRYDANQDGRVTAADALLVINRLARDVTAAQVAAAPAEGEDDESDAVDQLLTGDAFLNRLF